MLTIFMIVDDTLTYRHAIYLGMQSDSRDERLRDTQHSFDESAAALPCYSGTARYSVSKSQHRYFDKHAYLSCPLTVQRRKRERDGARRPRRRKKEGDHGSANETEDGERQVFCPVCFFATQASIYQQSAKEVQCGGKSGR